MNASQLILLFASLVILSTAILLTNRASIETQDERIAARNLYLTLNASKSLFEEIKTKIYDEKIISMISLNKDSLTSISKLGPENEVYPNFDDIDDFNGFTKNITSEINQIHNISVRVNYVSESNPDILSSVPTYYKLVTIRGFDQNQKQLFELKQIFSVW